MTWNPDDVVLTVWALVEILNGADRTMVIAGIASETGRTESEVDAAIRAVEASETQVDVLRLILQPLDGATLVENRRLLDQLVGAIREARARRR